MRFGSFWIGERDNELFNFLHKFETKLTVLKHNPVAWLHTWLNGFSWWFFLTFTHRNFFGKFFLLSGEFIDGTGRIGTWWQQEQNRDATFGLGPDVLHRIRDWVNVLLPQSTGNELWTCNQCSIFSNWSDQTHFHESPHLFFLLTHSFGKIWNGVVLWVVLFDKLNPTWLILLNQVWQLLEVWYCWLAECMFGEGDNVQPWSFINKRELISLWFWSGSFDVFSSAWF